MISMSISETDKIPMSVALSQLRSFLLMADQKSVGELKFWYNNYRECIIVTITQDAGMTESYSHFKKSTPS